MKKSDSECICCLLERLGKSRYPKDKERGMYEILEEILTVMDMPHPETFRKEKEITDFEKECCDRIWYNRCYLFFKLGLEDGSVVLLTKGAPCLKPGSGEFIHEDIWEGSQEAAQKKEELYGVEEMQKEYSDFEWGMLNGKLSALRWVMGSEIDFLDT